MKTAVQSNCESGGAPGGLGGFPRGLRSLRVFLSPGGPWEGGGHGWVPEGAIPGMGFPGVPPGALQGGQWPLRCFHEGHLPLGVHGGLRPLGAPGRVVGIGGFLRGLFLWSSVPWGTSWGAPGGPVAPKVMPRGPLALWGPPPSWVPQGWGGFAPGR